MIRGKGDDKNGGLRGSQWREEQEDKGERVSERKN